jgi:hypothetical protein
MANKNLKEKIEELVKEALEKMKAQREEFEPEEVEEEEEEVCIEPFKFLDPEDEKQMEEELNKLHEEIGKLEEFKSYEEVMMNPSVEINEEEIVYIPMDDVKLDPEEVEALNKLAEGIKPLDDVILLPCEVMGYEKLLIDTVNCNIKHIPILNIYVVAPLNAEIAKIDLNAETQSDADIEVHLIIHNHDGSMVHVLSDMATFVASGIVSLINMTGEEPLRITPSEFRGITSYVTMEEIKKLCEQQGCEE